jgi:hypothetical protein
MNEHKDIATSFKYVVDMETERNTRTKQYQPLLNIKSPRANTKLTGNATIAVSDTMVHSGPVPSPSTSHNRAPTQEPLSPSGSKGKRKVTFDIKPAVSGGEKRRTEVLEQQGEGQFKALLSAWGHWSDSPVQLRSLIWRMTTPMHIQELPQMD